MKTSWLMRATSLLPMNIPASRKGMEMPSIFTVEGTHSPAWISSRKTRVFKKTQTVEMVARKTFLSRIR